MVCSESEVNLTGLCVSANSALPANSFANKRELRLHQTMERLYLLFRIARSSLSHAFLIATNKSRNDIHYCIITLFIALCSHLHKFIVTMKPRNVIAPRPALLGEP